MRKCSRCEVEKEEWEYTERKNRKTGFNGVCKVCVNIRRKEAKIKNPEIYKKSRKEWYQKNREKQLEKQKIWQKVNSEKINEKQRKWYAKNRQILIEKRNLRTTDEQRNRWNEKQKNKSDYRIKHLSRCILNQYILKGRIVKPEKCQICGKNEKLDAHHSDYSKPLEVTWTCRVCHRALHRRLKKESQNAN